MQCKNCDQKLKHGDSYCPHCGQRADVTRLNFKQLIRDIWVAFSNTDEGVLLLIKELVYRPGKVARAYVSGRRKHYFNPFSYLAIMLAIALFFILRFEHFGIDYSQMKAEDLELLQFAFRYFNLFILFMCPVYAFVIWIFFLGNQTNYAENLVLSAYLSGQNMLYYIVAILLFILFPSNMNVLGLIVGLLITIWYITAILQFYSKRSFWSILKTILVIVITQIISQGMMMFAFSVYQL